MGRNLPYAPSRCYLSPWWRPLSSNLYPGHLAHPSLQRGGAARASPLVGYYPYLGLCSGVQFFFSISLALQLSYFVVLPRFSSLLSIATSPLRRSLLRTRDIQRRRQSRLRESPVASRRPVLPPPLDSSWNASVLDYALDSGYRAPWIRLWPPAHLGPDPAGTV